METVLTVPEASEAQAARQQSLEIIDEIGRRHPEGVKQAGQVLCSERMRSRSRSPAAPQPFFPSGISGRNFSYRA
jgi:hypothetical protein